MHVDTERFVSRVFFPVGIGALVLMLVVVFELLGSFTAIKGVYGLLAFLLAALVYYGTRERREPTSAVRADRYGKVVYVFVGLSIVVANFARSRFPALLLALPLGYTLLALQLRASPSPRRVLPQIVALFAVPPVTKYLTTGFYFGSSDTFVHVKYIEYLLRTGTFVGIPRYEYFPGMHLLGGTLSLAAGIDAYDSLMTLGIAIHLFLVVGVYLVGRITDTGTRDALYVAAAVATVEPILYFTNYFFPQSLAAVMLLYLLYVGFRLSTAEEPTHRAMTVFSAPLGIALVFTHHLTFVLFLPAFALVAAAPLVWDRWEGALPESAEILRIRSLPIAAAYSAALAYWQFEDRFLGSFVALGTRILTGELFASGGGAPAETIMLGGTLPSPTPFLAFRSLFSPEGIYYMALGAVFLLGVGWVVRSPRRYRRRLSLLAVGCLCSLLVLRTPLALPGLTRIRHPAGIFFAFVVGVGIYRLLNARSSRGVLAAVALALVVVLATTAPMASSAGDDLYRVNAGPDIWELYASPEPQADFATSEWVQVERTARFVTSTGSDVTTLPVTGRALDRFGAASRSPVTITNQSIRTETPLLLYRDNWIHHRAPFTEQRGGGGTVIVTESWLDGTVSRTDKVYTTGDVGLLYDDNRTFSPVG